MTGSFTANGNRRLMTKRLRNVRPDDTIIWPERGTICKRVMIPVTAEGLVQCSETAREESFVASRSRKIGQQLTRREQKDNWITDIRFHWTERGSSDQYIVELQCNVEVFNLYMEARLQMKSHPKEQIGHGKSHKRLKSVFIFRTSDDKGLETCITKKTEDK